MQIYLITILKLDTSCLLLEGAYKQEISFHILIPRYSAGKSFEILHSTWQKKLKWCWPWYSKQFKSKEEEKKEEIFAFKFIQPELKQSKGWKQLNSKTGENVCFTPPHPFPMHRISLLFSRGGGKNSEGRKI